MADPIYFSPLRTPLVDARTGLMAREWYLFFQALWLRTGGVSGPSNEDLLQGQSEGLQSGDLFGLVQRGDQDNAQAPVTPSLVPENDLEALTGRLSAAEALLAAVQQQLQDIKLAINTGA